MTATLELRERDDRRVLDLLTSQGASHVRIVDVNVGGIPHMAIVSREPLHVGNAVPDYRWHISVSAPDDVPSWNALVEIGHALRPGVVFVIGVPPRSWWLNVHPNVLHLYETRDANLIDQWRAERKGDNPS